MRLLIDEQLIAFVFRRNAYTAFELWQALYKPCDSYAEWLKETLFAKNEDTGHPLFKKGIDYKPFLDEHIKEINYNLTEYCAKSVAIISPGDGGHMVRQYLIECAEALHGPENDPFLDIFKK